MLGRVLPVEMAPFLGDMLLMFRCFVSSEKAASIPSVECWEINEANMISFPFSGPFKGEGKWGSEIRDDVTVPDA